MINKKVRNATPLVYDNIKFRSKLEVFCYKQLKENNLPIGYEKNKYVLSDKFIYTGYEYPDKLTSKGNTKRTVLPLTYTPDFIVKENIIIECKGRANDAFPIKWKLFKKLLHDKYKDDLYLFVPKNQKQILECVKIIKQLLN